MLKSFQTELSQVFNLNDRKGSTKSILNNVKNSFNSPYEKEKIWQSFNRNPKYSDIEIQNGEEQPLEVYIPIASTFEKNSHQNQQLHHLLKVEFATRYLMAIHVDPSSSNIKRFMEKMPQYTTFLRKGNGEDRYLVLRLIGNGPKKRSLHTTHCTNRGPSTKVLARNKHLSKEGAFETKSKLPSSNSSQSVTSAERGKWLYLLARDAISASGLSTSSRSDDSQKLKDKNIITQIEDFDSYSKRFLYPYNMLSKFPSNRKMSPMEKQIYDMERDFSTTIFSMIHQQRKKQHKSKLNADSPTPVQSNNEEITNIFTEFAKTQTNNAHRSLYRKQPSIIKIKNSSTSSLHCFSSPLSHNSTLHSAGGDNPIEPIFPNDHLSFEPREELRSRFSGLYQDENDNRSDVEIISDKELEKPPYIGLSEIKAMQVQFIRNFPFRMWKKKLSAVTLQSMKKVLNSPKLTEFISNFATFSYWIFLSEFGKNNKKDDVDRQFLNIYEEVMHLLSYNKLKQTRQVVELPIIILCIRVCVEGVFQTCYPNFWPSVFGRNMAKRLEIVISFLLDPQLYMSNLALIQSSFEERKLSKLLMKKMKQSGTSMQNKQKFVSPVVRYILQEPSSLGAKKMLKVENESDGQNLIISQLFNHDYIRSRLLSIILGIKSEGFAKNPHFPSIYK